MKNELAIFITKYIEKLFGFPNKDNLLTNSAKAWFYLIRSISILIATAEGISWGYFGSTFSDNRIVVVVAAIIVGSIMFLAVVAVESNLINTDLAALEYRQILYDEHPKTKLEKHKTKIAIFVRVAMVCFSVLITAPFLNQLVFNKDVERLIDSKQNLAITQIADKIKKHHQAKLDDAQKILSENRDLHRQEVGGTQGKKTTGRPGRGETAKSIEKTIQSNEKDIQELKTQMNNTLQEFDKAVNTNDYDLLYKKFGVDSISNGPAMKAAALNEISKQPGYKDTETAIKFFLILLLLSLLVLKIQQPESVRFYLSEALQDQWGRYLAGAFNNLLPLHEQPNRGGMTIYRFNYFVVRTLSMINRLKAFSHEKQQLEQKIKKLEGDIHKEERGIAHDLEQLESELNVLDIQVAKVRKLEKIQSNKVIDLRSKIENDKERLRNVADSLNQKDKSLDAKEVAIEEKKYMAEVNNAIASKSASLQQEETEHEEIERNLGTLTKRKLEVEKEIEKTRKPLNEFMEQKQIYKDRFFFLEKQIIQLDAEVNADIGMTINSEKEITKVLEAVEPSGNKQEIRDIENSEPATYKM